jgi:hypothetical protein
MAIDLTVPKSRRAVLAAVFGGMAAAAANAVARPVSALATDGQPILQGVDNGGSASTVVRSNSTTALQGVTDVASGAHYGVRGRSSSSSGIGTVGVAAAAAGGTIGVHGTAVSLGGVGVKGESPRHGVEGYATNTTDITAGVYGHAVSPQGIAVLAQNDANSTSAIAVHGRASGYGVFGLGFGNAVGVRGAANGEGGAVGVRGDVNSITGIGVLGQNNHASQFARGMVGVAPGGVGVQGWSGSMVAPASMAKTGVFGQCDIDFASVGTLGVSASGTGVRGLSTSGTGVEALAVNPSATGLKVIGKAVFSRSGKATVLAGQSQVIVNNIPLTSSSLVLATIQGASAAGVYVRNVSVSVSNSRFTIRVSKTVAANTVVGWFIAN